MTDSATGRIYNSAPTYIEGISALPQSIASMSYVTGTHAFKFGTTLTLAREDMFTTANQDLNLTVLNGVPVSVTVRATPLHTKASIKPDLGLYAQEQWSMRRLTLRLAGGWWTLRRPAQIVTAR